MYDPHRHAEELGLTVEYHPLKTANGLTIPEKKLILLRPRLRRILERSVLAHEIVHFEYMDAGRSPWQEDRADRIAAERLLTREALERASKHSDDPVAWAIELDVTPHLLEVWRRRNAA